MSVKLFLGSDIFKSALQGKTQLEETLKSRYNEIEKGLSAKSPARRQTVHGEDFHSQYQTELQKLQNQQQLNEHQLYRLRGESHLLFAPVTDILGSFEDDENDIFAHTYHQGHSAANDRIEAESTKYLSSQMSQQQQQQQQQQEQQQEQQQQQHQQQQLDDTQEKEKGKGEGNGKGKGKEKEREKENNAKEVDVNETTKFKKNIQESETVSRSTVNNNNNNNNSSNSSNNNTMNTTSSGANKENISLKARRASTSVVEDLSSKQKKYVPKTERRDDKISNTPSSTSSTSSTSIAELTPSTPSSSKFFSSNEGLLNETASTAHSIPTPASTPTLTASPSSKLSNTSASASASTTSTFETEGKSLYDEHLTPINFNSQNWRTVINAKDSIGLRRTALHHAAVSGNLEIAKMLISMGADLNAIDDAGNTPLHCATRDGRTEMVSLLIKCGAIIDSKDHHNQTPLHRAALNGDVETAEVLITSGAQINMKDREGKTPLMLAAASGKADIVTLLASNAADLNLQDNTGFTAIHWASFKGSSIVASLLVKLGANLSLKDFSNRNVLAVAADKHVCEVLKEQ